ncbi:MAG: hypothetical protein ACLR23_22600 [Clostridia bacterium]
MHAGGDRSAGKPRRAFFYRLSHRIAPLRHKRGIWVAVARRGRSKQASPGVHFSTGCHTGSHIPAITGGELDYHCTPEAFKIGKPRRAFFYRLPYRIAPPP